jgi:hypothetical protein
MHLSFIKHAFVLYKKLNNHQQHKTQTMSKKETFSMHSLKNHRESDIKYYDNLNDYWDNSIGTNLDKLKAFTKYVPFSEFPRLFARYEIFKKILNVHGNIIECGVHQGGGLMTWAILSSIFEPINHIRKITGFDTFDGFPELTNEDSVKENDNAKVGGLAVNSFEDLQAAIQLYDSFRPLGHINKVELIKGDASLTIEKYLLDNPHLVISLLYLDFDIYKPTKKAIELLLPRMPKGSIIAFDELNNKDWPGETLAVLETIGINNLKIERFSFQPQISFAVL